MSNDNDETTQDDDELCTWCDGTGLSIAIRVHLCPMCQSEAALLAWDQHFPDGSPTVIEFWARDEDYPKFVVGEIFVALTNFFAWEQARNDDVDA